jgi:hypothetical protein
MKRHYMTLDNGFGTVSDVAGLQAICDGLTAPVIDALLRKWLARLPHPFTAADRAAGYRYQPSVLQAEFSLTQMLDQPVSGRIFFEQTIRDNLDIGRPDQVSLIFNRQVRRNTPRSPAKACATPYSSPAPTTGSTAPASPSSTAHPHQPNSAPPPKPTKPPSPTSPKQRDSPQDLTQNHHT